VLATHRGFDLGALAVARHLAAATGAPLLVSTTTRLLVDANRSPHNRAVFSEWTRGLPAAQRESLMASHHRPHWQRVRAAVAALRRGGARVVHVAVHSFTPVWHGVPREVDVGLLYDPARRAERALCRAWRNALRRQAPALRVRCNAPYRGDSDSIGRALRRELPARAYLALELELSQALLASRAGCRRIAESIVPALREALASRT
jgi:predicted N-formylglutamate amidohydrolase